MPCYGLVSTYGYLSNNDTPLEVFTVNGMSTVKLRERNVMAGVRRVMEERIERVAPSCQPGIVFGWMDSPPHLKLLELLVVSSVA